MFTLKNWSVDGWLCEYCCYGNVYDNPRFRKGEYIHTSPILKLEECKGGYIARTFNSEYFLPQKAYKAQNSLEEFIAGISAQYQTAYNCAEKLLAVGDSLIYCFSVYYKTSSGIIKLEPEKNENGYIRYEYAADGFELLADITGSCIVTKAADKTANSLYILSIRHNCRKNLNFMRNPNCLEKKSYCVLCEGKQIDLGYKEINYENELPF